MIYVLAAIGALTVAVLLWRAFGPAPDNTAEQGAQAPLAPDDDPDFLRRLDEHNRGNGDGG